MTESKVKGWGNILCSLRGRVVMSVAKDTDAGRCSEWEAVMQAATMVTGPTNLH